MNCSSWDLRRLVMLLPIFFSSCLDFDREVKEFTAEYPGISKGINHLDGAYEINPDKKTGGILTISTPVEYPEGRIEPQHPSFSAWGPGIVYSRLFRLRIGLGVELPSQIVECDLCESWSLRDQTTLEILLRKDVLWQNIPPVNGRLVTVEDVALSLRSWIKTQSSFQEGILNIQEIETMSSGILIHMLNPDPDILILLANGSSKILPLEHLEIEDLHPSDFVGTGPWVIKVADSKNRFEFHSNKNYFEKGYPYLDGLRILVIKDAPTRLAAFKNGILDVGQLPNPESIEYLTLHPEIRNSMYVDYGSGVNLLLNTHSAPFSSLRIRQALFFSIDPWKLNKDILRNSAVVSSGIPIIESSWVLDKEIWETGLNQKTRALELLSTEDHELLSSLELLVADYGDSYLEYAEGFVNQAESVGFELFITALNPTDYLEKVWTDRDFSIALGPTPPIKIPNEYLKTIVHSQGGLNVSGYQEKVLDDLIQRQSGEWNLSNRTSLIRSVKLHMLENAVGFMPATSINVWAWWPEVNNLHLNFANSEYIFWSRVSLEDKAQ